MNRRYAANGPISCGPVVVGHRAALSSRMEVRFPHRRLSREATEGWDTPLPEVRKKGWGELIRNQFDFRDIVPCVLKYEISSVADQAGSRLSGGTIAYTRDRRFPNSSQAASVAAQLQNFNVTACDNQAGDLVKSLFLRLRRRSISILNEEPILTAERGNPPSG